MYTSSSLASLAGIHNGEEYVHERYTRLTYIYLPFCLPTCLRILYLTAVCILGLAISILSKDKRQRMERADGGVGGRKLIIITQCHGGRGNATRGAMFTGP